MITKPCPICAKPMKQLWSSFYCDCKKEVKETTISTFSNPEEAYEYAVCNGSSEESRLAACKDSKYAFWYAEHVDKCPRDETRKGACKDPIYAYCYADDIDKCSRDDTRKAACKDPEYAYWYAKDVDKCKHPDTEQAVKGSSFEEDYKKI